MQVDGEISKLKKKKKRGVTQGCVLFSDLFSPYSEIIMQNPEGYLRIKEGGHNIQLRYTDDTVLIQENKSCDNY